MMKSGDLAKIINNKSKHRFQLGDIVVIYRYACEGYKVVAQADVDERGVIECSDNWCYVEANDVEEYNAPLAEEKQKRAPSRSKVVIHWNFNKTKWWYQIEDTEGIIIMSNEFDSEVQCRDRIKRIRKVTRNRFMKIEVYDGKLV